MYRDHPRLRGEKCQAAGFDQRIPGSPPLTRGKVDDFDGFNRLVGITPAYAGKRRFVRPIAHLNQDHPRLRGEKPD